MIYTVIEVVEFLNYRKIHEKEILNVTVSYNQQYD